jgi:hypothetical protein
MLGARREMTSEMVGAISAFMFQKEWTKVGEMDVDGTAYDIARHSNSSSVALGRLQPYSGISKPGTNVGKMEFGTLFSIHMSPAGNRRFRHQGEALDYPTLNHVHSVAASDTARGIDIAKLMYRWLVGQQIVLLGNRERYFGGRWLWVALSNDIDVVVDLIDYALDDRGAVTVLERGVTLHRGQYDADLDRAVLGYDEGERDIRLVLRGV